MAEAIRFILTHLPIILTVIAVAIAAVSRRPPNAAERFLAWLLLLPVGIEMLWAGSFHVFVPHTAASFIGWQVSPFQFEIGVADMAFGAVAVVSFWRSLEFKAAAVMYLVLFYLGVAVGHVHQAVAAGNFSPGNFGVLLALTVLKMILLPVLLVLAWRQRPSA